MTTPVERVLVKEIKAYAVQVRGVTLAVCPKESDAKDAAQNIEYNAGNKRDAERRKRLLVR